MGSPITIICLVVGLILAVVGLVRPLVGMLVFVLIHFVQPGELVPALEPFRIELAYGLLLIASLTYQGVLRSVRSLLSDRIILGATLLLASAVLSVPFAVWVGGALDTLQQLAKLITLVLLLAAIVDSQPRLRALLWCMVAVAVWFAGSSLSAYAHGDVFAVVYDWGTFERAQGLNSIVGGPNELAGLLLALFPMLIAVLRSTKNLFLRIVLLASGVLVLFAIAFTGSRIAMIGLLTIGFFYIVQSRRRVLTCLACVSLAVVVWASLPRIYHDRYLTLENYAEGGELDASNELRLQIWKAGGQIFLHSPIVGVGAGQFRTAYGLLFLRGVHAEWMNPHNLLIQVACELGIIGLIAFSYFMWSIFTGIMFVIRRRSSSSDLNYQTALACLVMYVGTIILSVVGHTLYRPYWYLLAGLVVANQRIVRALRSESEEVDLASEARETRAPRWRPSGEKWHVPGRLGRFQAFRRIR